MLTEGSVNPHDILSIKGVLAVQDYLIQEVQRVYRMQGVDTNDKHIEVIVRQMLRKVRVEEVGDTNLLPGALVDKSEFAAENEELDRREAAGRRTVAPPHLFSGTLGHYQGLFGHRFLPVRCIIPGNYACVD